MMPKLLFPALTGLTLAVAIAAAPVASRAQGAKKTDAPEKLPTERTSAAERKGEPKPEAAGVSDVQRQFCLNNAATANDQRLAWQVAKIAELETALKQRVGELEAKRVEYAEWLKKRDEAMKKSEDNVVAIYAKMRPDAAAAQLAAMDDAMAAAVIAKLNPRAASAVLAEMEPGRAARLANAMVGPPPPDKKKS